MDQAEEKVEPPAPGEPPSRNGRGQVALPPGRSVDITAETTQTDRALMAAVENALLAPRPRRRGKAISATPMPVSLLPPGLAGTARLLRQKLADIALACGSDRRCWEKALAGLKPHQQPGQDQVSQ